jgi:glycosyltransferase involved in cell wall biosynthesis
MVNNSGIGVYIKNYVVYLLEKVDCRVSLIGRREEINQAFPDSKSYTLINFDAPIYSIEEQLKLPFLIPTCDIFWSPHYNVPLLPIRAKKRLVTIPDAAHLALSETFEFSFLKKVYAKLVFRCATLLSDHISTISHFSKEEIIKFTGVSPNKISVIHLGIDNDLFRKIPNSELKNGIKAKYSLPEKYILFVGNVKPHKNLRTLIKAFNSVKGNIPDYKILIVGKKEGFITGDNKIFKLIEYFELQQSIVFTGYVPFEDLPYLYNLASVFAFPSIYEGFGFPPLEAMACGCPVVSSDRASMPEICGEAVRYIDAHNKDSLANGILEMINNADLQKKFVEGGNIQYKKFTWSNSVKEFANLLNSSL